MSEPIVEIDNLVLRRGSRRVLGGVSLSVDKGEVLALMGASGSGKTTILRAVAGLERFEAGRITVDGTDVLCGPQPASRELHRKVGLVFQFHSLFEHLTVMDNICLAPTRAHQIAPDDAKTRAHDLLVAFGVDHRAQALPRELSGGEAQRVAIARALAVDPPVLLMDEPTASLDPARRLELGDLIRRLVHQGRTLVLATHDEGFVQDCCSRVVNLRDGLVCP